MRTDEVSTLKLESQKLQARAFDGSTQPHCKHVFVTGAFCAADASTPVRSDIGRISPRMKKQVENAGAKTRMQHHLLRNPRHTGSGWEARLGFDLLCEQVAAEGHSTVEGDRGEVSAPATLALGPGANCRRDAPGHRLQGVEHTEVNADGEGSTNGVLAQLLNCTHQSTRSVN